MSNYIPCDQTLLHMIWRKRHFTEDNTTPKFHYHILDQYYNSPDYIKPVKAFRGSAKSTNTCYVALHRVENLVAHYTLIVSDTATQAEALIADIADMLDSAPSLPYTIVRSIAGEIELSYLGRRYFIVGKGAGSSMRGIKRGRKRPDLIILDDIVNDKLVMNTLRMIRLKDWFYGALLPSLYPSGEIYAVGTPLHKADLFMHLCSQHKTLEIPLDDTAWPDLFPPEWIARRKQEYKDGGTLRIYKREYELVLTDSENQLFHMNKLSALDVDELPSDLTWFMFCDLAFSEKTTADYSALVAIGIDKMGRWYVYPRQGRWRPSETARQILDMVDKFKVVATYIESGSSYMAVIEHIDRIKRDESRFAYIEEMSHLGKSKTSRISALEPIVNTRRMIIVDNGDDAEQLVEQMESTTLDGCVSEHDDLLDALSMGMRTRLYYIGERIIPELNRQEYLDALNPRPDNDDLGLH